MIEVESYVVTDGFFGAPYIDEDEDRDLPIPHRHIHGGFLGTDTRFRFYFPHEGYEGRCFTPLSGAHGGTEDFFGSPFGEAIGGVSACSRLGGYTVDSNQGHIGDEIDPKGGEDPTLYGHRASAEAVRFSKHVAAQIYGSPPHHSYVFGGSGGGRRSPLCLENAPDVWDGALPFMGGGDIAEHGNTQRVKGAQNISFATMFNVQRLLEGPKLAAVVDAMAPGGSGDPFVGLTTHEREELAALYRLGFPRGDEYMIGEQMGQIWLWSATADLLAQQDPEYFDNFWTKPGYVGHDFPQLVNDDLINTTLTVDRVITIGDLIASPDFSGPEFAMVRAMAGMRAGMGQSTDLAIAVEVKGVGRGYRLGAGLQLVSGKAKGRQLYATDTIGDMFLCDGMGEASILRFADVLPGDEILVDNRKFLAYHYWARHHVMDDLQFDSLRLDGRPIYPQHPPVWQSPLMGVAYSGQYKGKLIWVHHTHDSSLWPPQGVIYANAVAQAQGEAGAAERFRLRWTENAEHVPPMILKSPAGRAVNTWLVDYLPVIEQSLKDLVAWVEQGVDPAATSYEYHDGLVTLPATAAERGGIQSVVNVTANGAVRAEVAVGETVTLEVKAEVPTGAGTVIAVEWDFDGSGSYPFRHSEVDGSAARVALSTTHTFDRPGTYFVTAKVESHRDGDVSATSRRVPNVAQARVVVS